MPIGPINVLNATRTVVMANAAITRSRKEDHMTYDQAYEKIFALFKSGWFNNWELTDPDTLQACKPILDSYGTCVGYCFIELQPAPLEEDALFFEEDYLIDDYNNEQLWQYGRFYYGTYEEFLRIPLYQKFECVFEEESSGELLSAEEAYKRYLAVLNQ